MSRPPPHVRCPTCGRIGDWFAGPYGPFCSRRCKLIDLGKWLGEEHVISEPLRPEHLSGRGGEQARLSEGSEDVADRT